MPTRATCVSCRRSFELADELATPGRRCVYCGGNLAITRVQAEAPAASTRRDPVMGNCPICDTQERFEPGERTVKCRRCGTEIIEPESPGTPARLAPPPVRSQQPPIAVPCPHCGGRARMPVESPRPDVRCEQCLKTLTPAYLPLEKWTDIRGLAPAGTLTDTLLLVLRSRWNNGTVSPGEVVRHVEGMRLVVQWLQQKPKERQSEFPLPVDHTAEVLKHFVFKVDRAQIQFGSGDRVILVLPSERSEPVEHDTSMRRLTESDSGDQQPPALILSIAKVPAGSVFGFLVRGDDGSTGALAQERVDEIKKMIADSVPRATFKFLGYRFVFGEWIRPATMMFVTPTVAERELHKLGIPEARLKPLLERLQG